MNPKVCATLAKHFGSLPLHELVTATREFPTTARLDLQAAISAVLTGRHEPNKILGLHGRVPFSTVTFAHLLVEGDQAVLVAPLQYDHLDVGEMAPSRCLRNGLWLCTNGDIPFCVLLMPAEKMGRNTGLHLEIAVPAGEEGLELTERLLARNCARGFSKLVLIAARSCHSRFRTTTVAEFPV